jgi:hypothetical protein
VAKKRNWSARELGLECQKDIAHGWNAKKILHTRIDGCNAVFGRFTASVRANYVVETIGAFVRLVLTNKTCERDSNRQTARGKDK